MTSFFDNLSSNNGSKPINDDPLVYIVPPAQIQNLVTLLHQDVETFGKAAENYRYQHRRFNRRGIVNCKE